MATLKFELEDGTTVFVEATEPHKNSPGFIPSSHSGEDDADKPAISFETQIDNLRKMSAVMMKKFREGFSEQPSDIDISFGLKASIETNSFIISRTGAEANFSVALHWRERDKEKKPE